MHPRARIEYRSAALRAAGQWRSPDGGMGLNDGAAGLVDVRSNDYLGLARRGVSRETAGAVARVGAGASRLISGTWPAHLELEAAISRWLGTEACLLFTSGYAANVGTISALAGPGETVFSDALNHASIIDGCRLSRAEVVVLPHGNVEALERALTDTRGVRWVVTETYFGMDADTPDLRQVRALCDSHEAALVVDEAHALGVFGPRGRGLCAEAGVVPDVLIGGMGKALGTQGGFAATSRVYRDWLWNRARSMVYSTAPSPVLCELAAEQVARVEAADTERERLKALEGRLAAALSAARVPTTAGRRGPVFPIVFGSERAVLEAAERAAQFGVRCQAIRPPTVPAGKSRLRVSLRADLSDDDLQQLTDALIGVWETAGVSASTSERQRASERVEWPRDADRSQNVANGADTAHPRSEAGVRHTVARDSWDVVDGGAVDGSRGADYLAAVSATARARHDSRRDIAPHTRVPTSHADPLDTPRRRPPLLILGTGTGVGKTFVSSGLVNALAQRGCAVAGLKPIETGLEELDAEMSDAARLAEVSFHVKLPFPHPLYAYPAPVAPSRAARAAGEAIDTARISEWVRSAAATGSAPDALDLVIETAGGVFSPLGPSITNFELAQSLDPATWVLVAPDRLGVLHDVTSCLYAMTALGRRPDWLILSAPADPDASTGTNAKELASLNGCPPIIELPRNDPKPLVQLLGPLGERLS